MSAKTPKTEVTEFHFLVGYQGTWTKSHPRDVVDRLKVGIRDKVREIFPQELMDSWLMPHADSPHQDPPLDPSQQAFQSALRLLSHPEHETEATLDFAQAKLDEVNEHQGRALVAETNGSGGAGYLDGCLYIDHAWYKIDSFAVFESGEPVMVEAIDSVSGTSVSIPLVATVMYECKIP